MRILNPVNNRGIMSRIVLETIVLICLLSISVPLVSGSADFSGTPVLGPVPLTVNFTDSSTGGPTGWAWYFGDENWTEPAWTQMTAHAGWTARDGQSSVAMPDGSIVLMGGYDESGDLNDVWRSFDKGATWTQMTAHAQWVARRAHISVAMPDGSIVLMGGINNTSLLSNYTDDVWRSTDYGATWTRMAANVSQLRGQDHSGVAMSDGSIVLMGGQYLSDVWRSTDYGATWTQMTANASWEPRGGYAPVVMPDSSIVLMGGMHEEGIIQIEHKDVWRSTDNGATWTQMTANASWGPRSGHTSVAMPDGSIILMGGHGWRDIWRSTDYGATWTQVTANANWPVRSDHNSVVLPDGSIVLLGGIYNFVIYYNDVWRLVPTGSSLQNPSHTYTTPGTYQVSLQSNNSSSYSSTRKPGYINVTAGGEGPVAGFTATPTSGPAPLTVYLTDTSTGSPTCWNWSFGDGSTFNTTNEAEKNATKTYTTPGSYIVRLTVSDSAGSSTTTPGTTITVTGEIPENYVYSYDSPVISNSLSYVKDLIVNSTGTIFILRDGGNHVDAYTRTGQFLFEFGGYGSDDGQFGNAETLAIDKNDNIYVGDYLNHRVCKFAPNGIFIKNWGGYDGNFDHYNHYTFASPNVGSDLQSGNIWVGSTFAEVYANTIIRASEPIREFTPDGTYKRTVGTIDGSFSPGTFGISGVFPAVDARGTVYGLHPTTIFVGLSDPTSKIEKFPFEGSGTTILHEGGYNRIRINQGGNILLSGSTVTEYTPSGIMKNRLESLPLNYRGVAEDTDGSLYVLAGNEYNSINSLYRYARVPGIPVLTTSSQNTSSHGSTFSFTLTGQFQTGATVSLTKTGYPDINATNVQVPHYTTLTGQFLIPLDAGPGIYNLTVRQKGYTAVNTIPITLTPTITGITPISGFNTGTVSITNLRGYGFLPDATVNLTRTGYPNITATDRNITSPTKITCRFPIAGAAPGFWNLTVTNPDGYSGILVDVFGIRASPPGTGFTANLTYGSYPLSIQFNDTSVYNPTGWSWFFGDENWGAVPIVKVTDAPWAKRYDHTSVVLLDGSIVLISGVGYAGNDVWRSTDNGLSWTLMTSNGGWPRKAGAESVALPDGSIILMGGNGGNDIWRSVDMGRTWTFVTNAPWQGRSEFGSVVMPDGSIVIMGGQGGGLLNDVWRSVDGGRTWTMMPENAAWSPRDRFACVLTAEGSILVMGGWDGGNKNDIWRSDDYGATWSLVGSGASWAPRHYLTSQCMPDGSIVVIGGTTVDVWRSTDNGVSWTRILSNLPYFCAYPRHTSAVLHDGSLVIMGGRYADDWYACHSQVWRYQPSGSANRNPVHTYTSVGTYNVTLQTYNEAGSSIHTKNGNITVLHPMNLTGIIPVSGYNGGPVTVTITGDEFKSGALVSLSMAGNPAITATNVNVSSPTLLSCQLPLSGAAPGLWNVTVTNPDGRTVTGKNLFRIFGPAPLAGFSADRTRISAGFSAKFTDTSTNSTTGWSWLFGDENLSSAVWMQMTANGGWTPRWHTSSVVMPDGTIILMGGQISGGQKNDVWKSTDSGKTWTLVTENANWTPRYGHSSVIMPDGSIVLMGGYDGSYKNDVWRSRDNGETWTQITNNANWSKRSWPSCIVATDNSIILMGGDITGSYTNDVWRSPDGGITWNQVTAHANWTPRYGQASVLMPDGSIILTSGRTGSSSFANDVWRSPDNGQTWTQMVANAGWQARAYHVSAGLPDGSIILLGGWTGGTAVKTDAWFSKDSGQNWFKIIENAPCSTRSSPASVLLPEGSLLIFGGYSGTTGLNDAWKFDVSSSHLQNPVHIFQTPGVYNVSLQASNANGYGSTIRTGYIQVSPTTLTPSSAPNTGPVTLSINGTGFGTVSLINLTNGSMSIPGTVTSQSNRTITCTFPLTGAATRPYALNVRFTDGNYGLLPDVFTVTNTSPTITAITPVTAFNSTTVQTSITGTAFRNGIIVSLVNGSTTIPGSITSRTPSLIVATFPLGNARTGPYNLTIRNIDGSSATRPNAFTVTAAGIYPVIHNTSSGSGVNNIALPFIINGTNYRAGATVILTNTSTTITAVSPVITPNQIRCSLPLSGAPIGLYNLTVRNTDGSSGVKQNAFLVMYPSPTVGTVSPLSAYNTSPALITITGTNFVANCTVSLVNRSTTIPGVVSSFRTTKLTATFPLPLCPARVYNVTVINPGGPNGTKVNGLNVIAPGTGPVIADITPDSGPNTVALPVTINGTNFRAGMIVTITNGSTTKTITPAPITLNQTKCTFPLVGLPTGAYDLSVRNTDGSIGALDEAFTVTNPKPVISSVAPVSGFNTGLVGVTISGSSFVTTCSVTLWNQSTVIPGTVSSFTSAKFIGTFDLFGQPEGKYNLTVTNPGGITGTKTNCFTVVLPGTVPVIANFSPKIGVNTAALPFTINGTNFRAGATVSITNNSTSKTIPGTLAGTTKLTCNLPLTGLPIGIYNLTVCNTDGSSDDWTDALVVMNPEPKITSLTPPTGYNTGPVQLTITGSGFVKDLDVKLVNRTTNIPGTALTVTPTKITGTFDISGSLNGSYNLTVINPGGPNSTKLNCFTIQSSGTDPWIVNITPDAGVNTATLPATILGGNFRTGATITIVNGPSSKTFPGTLIGTTKLTCNLPLTGMPIGLYDLTVRNTDGSNITRPTAFLVKNPDPAITTLNPISGYITAPIRVTITGSKFVSGAEIILVNNSSTVNGSVISLSATSITGSFPISGAIPGRYNLTVINPGGTYGSKKNAFTILAPGNAPVISVINPSSGFNNANLPIVITGQNFRNPSVHLSLGSLVKKALPTTGKVSTATVLYVTLPLTGIQGGLYNITVANSDGVNVTAQDIFYVTDQAWISKARNTVSGTPVVGIQKLPSAGKTGTSLVAAGPAERQVIRPD